jgi:hypothetical protein
MSDRARTKAAMQPVGSIIDRLCAVLQGETVGAGSLALLTVSVMTWKKTGLSDEELFNTIRELLRTYSEAQN